MCRRFRQLVFLVCLCSCACAGVAQAGTLSWSGATAVASAHGGIVAAACPSATDCTVVSADGSSESFNPATPTSLTAGQGTGLGAEPDTSLSCPSTTECLLGDEQSRVWMFDPLASGTAFVDSFAGVGATVVSCPNTTQCTVGGLSAGNGLGTTSEATLDPVSASGLDSEVAVPMAGVAISCPAVTQCTEVGGANEVSFNPQDPAASSSPIATDVDVLGAQFTAISCPSTTQCTAVDTQGRAITFNPQLPSQAVASTIDAGNSLESVSCVTNAQCVAADSAGNVVQGNPSTGWSTPQSIAAHALTAVACTSAGACVAADNAGNVYVSTGQVSTATAAASSATSATSASTNSTASTATVATAASSQIVAGRAAIGSIAAANTGLRVTLKCAGAKNARCTFYLSLAAGLRRGKAATKTVTIASGTHTVAMLIRASVRGMLKKYGKLYGVLDVYQKLSGHWNYMGYRSITMFW